MATLYTSAMTTPTQSSTGSLKRTVSDTLRHLMPGNPITALISSGMLSGINEAKTEKGMIRKRKVMTPKYEAFTYSPLAVEFTVSSRTSATEFVVSSADGLHVKMCLFNTRNKTVARIQTISSTTITVVSVGDATSTFDTAADDVLLALAPAYEENSSSPYILQKDYDHLYNFTQITRGPVAISNSAKGNPHYAGDFWRGLKKRNVYEVMRKVELAALFSNRPSSTNETTADATNGAFRTTRGLLQWKDDTWDAGGSMTYDRWLKELSEKFDETIGTTNDLVSLCGTSTFATLQQWAVDKLVVNTTPGGDKEMERYGITAMRFVTAKQPKGVRLVVHDAFDRGSLNKSMLIFDPELIEYVYLRDRDFKANNGIQNNDVDGVEDEIIGEWGINPIDGGKNILLVNNMW